MTVDMIPHFKAYKITNFPLRFSSNEFCWHKKCCPIHGSKYNQAHSKIYKNPYAASHKQILKLTYICLPSHWELSSRQTLQKHAYSNTGILKILPPKHEKFQTKKFWYFSYFCSRHRLWVPVRTVLSSTHNLCFWAEIRKITYTSVNPSFTI